MLFQPESNSIPYYQRQIFLTSKSPKIFKKLNFLLLKGPLGVGKLAIPVEATVRLHQTRVSISGKFTCRAVLETFYKTFVQVIRSVEFGSVETLSVSGVGWRASLGEDKPILVLNIGYSHPVFQKLSKGVEALVEDKQQIRVYGRDSSQVRHVVAALCRSRKFDTYKGKGVFVRGIPVSLKASSKSKS